MSDALLDEEVIRKQRLARLRELGVNPYPSKVHDKSDISGIKEKLGEKHWISGRIVSIRPHGKIAFLDISDNSGKIQLFIAKAELNEEQMQIFDITDIMSIVSCCLQLST